jgi:hypothetical protein
MKRFFVKMALFLVVALCTSVYEPLRAMADSTNTLTVPKTTTRPFWIWQIMASFQQSSNNDDFNRRVLQIQTDNPSVQGFNFNVSPMYVMWNHNRWIFQTSVGIVAISGLTQFGSISSNGLVAERSGFDIAFTVGYAVIDAPRFRLYPMLSSIAATDVVTITRQTSLANLLQNPGTSLSMERDAGGFGVAVGADYRFPMEYGDFYIMAKAGYNFSTLGTWKYNGVWLQDADINWFSRRGVFFQIGIGFGTKQE